MLPGFWVIVYNFTAAGHYWPFKTIALLDKPTRREVDVKASWTGFEIPDEFVVGYGIDYAQMNRSLPYIGKVRFVED